MNQRLYIQGLVAREQTEAELLDLLRSNPQQFKAEFDRAYDILEEHGCEIVVLAVKYAMSNLLIQMENNDVT